jgi:hypothetical protein
MYYVMYRNQDGGFNLSNSLKITHAAHAAYVASVVESLSSYSQGLFSCFDPDEYLDFRASSAEIQSLAPTAGEREEILDVTKLRSMLGDKEKKQSLRRCRDNSQPTAWHKKEVSILMDHFQGDTKKLGWFVSIAQWR